MDMEVLTFQDSVQLVAFQLVKPGLALREWTRSLDSRTSRTVTRGVVDMPVGNSHSLHRNGMYLVEVERSSREVDRSLTDNFDKCPRMMRAWRSGEAGEEDSSQPAGRVVEQTDRGGIRIGQWARLEAGPKRIEVTGSPTLERSETLWD